MVSGALKTIVYWRDRLGIEPSYPGTQDTDGFEDRGGHQYPIQPRIEQLPLYLERYALTIIIGDFIQSNWSFSHYCNKYL